MLSDDIWSGVDSCGASWVLDTSIHRQEEPERTITQIETAEPGKIVTLWTAVTDLICLLDMTVLSETCWTY